MNKLLFATAFFCIAAGPAWALGNFADVAVYDRTENRVLSIYSHEGRHYVVGKPGNEYQLTLRNQQSAEIMTVISVDGVNVVSGETANWNQTGYVFGPNSNFSIKGWRKSMQRVARFFFTEIDNSYAARTGRPENVGVIGVAVFRKKSEPVIGIGREWDRKRQADRAEVPRAEAQGGAAESVAQNAADAAGRLSTGAPAPQVVEKSLGTGHGASESSPVRYTNFERASPTPDEIITIQYDSYRNLLAQGVIKAPAIARPTPFPGQFVPDPR
jgi:hypothetical protein